MHGWAGQESRYPGTDRFASDVAWFCGLMSPVVGIGSGDFISGVFSPQSEFGGVGLIRWDVQSSAALFP